MANPSAQFHIQLDGIKLTAAQSKALAADLDKVVSSHLAKIDNLGGFTVTRPIGLNPDWLGIWLRSHRLGRFADAPSLDDVGGILKKLPQPGL